MLRRIRLGLWVRRQSKLISLQFFRIFWFYIYKIKSAGKKKFYLHGWKTKKQTKKLHKTRGKKNEEKKKKVIVFTTLFQIFTHDRTLKIILCSVLATVPSLCIILRCLTVTLLLLLGFFFRWNQTGMCTPVLLMYPNHWWSFGSWHQGLQHRQREHCSSPLTIYCTN